mmetsp:Transcript_10018/g.42107  ORF Transcript_10018/g.42107 Transcript_10018/m.42107 type:complete len:205 (-) Transcript_10018:727-1341(-)
MGGHGVWQLLSSVHDISLPSNRPGLHCTAHGAGTHFGNNSLSLTRDASAASDPRPRRNRDAAKHLVCLPRPAPTAAGSRPQSSPSSRVAPDRSICRVRFNSEGHANVVKSTEASGITGVCRRDSRRADGCWHTSRVRSWSKCARRPTPGEFPAASAPTITPPFAQESRRTLGNRTPAICFAATAFMSSKVGLSMPSCLTHVKRS